MVKSNRGKSTQQKLSDAINRKEKLMVQKAKLMAQKEKIDHSIKKIDHSIKKEEETICQLNEKLKQEQETEFVRRIEAAGFTMEDVLNMIAADLKP